ncbi:hypothetical protein P43SY_001049 [Pythium insidiosum]|uniref:Protein kinase domain-containing protein n=1 Tax=Pythium insidiosum TaxID=114742 RepID=A0AAD5Q2F0_PYTIN|nr:hypothetical protein P43SY_001049 [Pythium insidiosum]
MSCEFSLFTTKLAAVSASAQRCKEATGFDFTAWTKTRDKLRRLKEADVRPICGNEDCWTVLLDVPSDIDVQCIDPDVNVFRTVRKMRIWCSVLSPETPAPTTSSPPPAGSSSSGSGEDDNDNSDDEIRPPYQWTDRGTRSPSLPQDIVPGPAPTRDRPRPPNPDVGDADGDEDEDDFADLPSGRRRVPAPTRRPSSDDEEDPVDEGEDDEEVPGYFGVDTSRRQRQKSKQPTLPPLPGIDSNASTPQTISVLRRRPEEWRTTIVAVVALAAAVVLAEVIALLVRRRRRNRHRTPRSSAPASTSNGSSITDTLEYVRLDDDELTGTATGVSCPTFQVDAALSPFYIPATEIEDLRLLGTGGCAVVYLVRLHGGQLAAAKRLASDRVGDRDARQALVDEIKLNTALHHPNIVAFIGASWTNRNDLQAIFEFVPNGDLRTYLETTPVTPWTHEKLQVALDIAYALAYLHNQQPSAIVHRDLKSRNVLLTIDDSSDSETIGGGQRMQAKLTDFGVSRSMSVQQSMTTGVGTSRWLAPEVITGGGEYNMACDIYSFGVVLTELDTHSLPFGNVRGPDGTMLPDVAVLRMVAQQRLQPGLSPTCPEMLVLLARQCMAYDPEERPTASDVCASLRELMVDFHPLIEHEDAEDHDVAEPR